MLKSRLFATAIATALVMGQAFAMQEEFHTFAPNKDAFETARTIAYASDRQLNQNGQATYPAQLGQTVDRLFDKPDLSEKEKRDRIHNLRTALNTLEIPDVSKSEFFIHLLDACGFITNYEEFKSRFCSEELQNMFETVYGYKPHTEINFHSLLNTACKQIESITLPFIHQAMPLIHKFDELLHNNFRSKLGTPHEVPSLKKLAAQALAKANTLPYNEISRTKLVTVDGDPIFNKWSPDAERCLVMQEICKFNDFSKLTAWEKRDCIHKLQKAIRHAALNEQDQKTLLIEALRALKYFDQLLPANLSKHPFGALNAFKKNHSLEQLMELLKGTYGYKSLPTIVQEKLSSWTTANALQFVSEFLFFILTLRWSAEVIPDAEVLSNAQNMMSLHTVTSMFNFLGRVWISLAPCFVTTINLPHAYIAHIWALLLIAGMAYNNEIDKDIYRQAQVRSMSLICMSAYLSSLARSGALGFNQLPLSRELLLRVPTIILFCFTYLQNLSEVLELHYYPESYHYKNRAKFA